MPKIISTKFTQGVILGVAFMEQRQGDIFVGVAENVNAEDAEKFSGADGFSIEGFPSTNAKEIDSGTRGKRK